MSMDWRASYYMTRSRPSLNSLSGCLPRIAVLVLFVRDLDDDEVITLPWD